MHRFVILRYNERNVRSGYFLPTFLAVKWVKKHYKGPFELAALKTYCMQVVINNLQVDFVPAFRAGERFE